MLIPEIKLWFICGEVLLDPNPITGFWASCYWAYKSGIWSAYFIPLESLYELEKDAYDDIERAIVNSHKDGYGVRSMEIVEIGTNSKASSNILAHTAKSYGRIIDVE